MAIQHAGLKLRPPEEAAVRAEALAELPGHTIVAIFEDKNVAAGAAVQMLTTDPGALLWLRSGRDASAAIRRARAGRSVVTRLLRGFGDEELTVREVLRQTDDGRTVLVLRKRGGKVLPSLEGASHVYQFRLWTARAIR